MTGIAPRT